MEDLRFMRLWDCYQPLLTERQREITNLYFNCDLSLAEIAEQKGCSRQSVSDCLIKCRKQLEDYEEKLRFAQTLAEAARIAEEIEGVATKLPAPYREQIETVLRRVGGERAHGAPNA